MTLPIGWADVSLEVICETITTGRRPKGGVRGINEGVLSLGGEHVSADGHVDLTTPRFIPPKFAAGLAAPRILPNDILVVKDGATTGKIALVDSRFEHTEAYPNEHVFVCRAAPGIEARLLFTFLRSEAGRTAILSDFRGAAQGGISRGFADKVHIPLAPQAEQSRIIARLDALTARITRARTELNRVKALAEKSREAILSTEYQRPITNGTGTLAVSKLCTSITDGDHQAPPKSIDGIPFITISAINDGLLDLSKATRFVPRSYFTSIKDERRPRIGDVLYSVTGSIGIPVLVHTAEAFVFQRHIAILRPDKSACDPEWLTLILGSSQVREQAQSVATGTAQLTIPLRGLREFMVPNISLQDQRLQAERIGSALAHIERFRIEATRGTHLLDRLEAAIITKAFRGELVPQDPSDEPAITLLAQIKKTASLTTRRKSNAARKPAKTHKSPRDTPTMKSRQDKDVKGQRYLAAILEKLDGRATAEQLFAASDLSEVDFFKQLSDEYDKRWLAVSGSTVEINP